jgi:cytosine/adenosine deaminase-related metal-dependent hydrolase
VTDYIQTPRFVPTCSLELLRGLGKLAAEYDCHIQSHAAETPHQAAAVHRMHPDIGGGRDIAIFESVGLLNSKTTMAHGCFLRDYEVRCDPIRSPADKFILRSDLLAFNFRSAVCTKWAQPWQPARSRI